MFQIAICDDDVYFRQSIREFVSGYLQKKEIVYQIDLFCSGEEFVSLGSKIAKYTVVFLDINMAEVNGIAAARKIRSISKGIFIVFISAFYEYALEGYKVEAIRYLIKDSNFNNFQNAIDECMDSIIEKMDYAAVRKRFGFKGGVREISLTGIIYRESNLHKLLFYVMEDKLETYTLYETLNKMEEKLAGNNFIRIHQSYLVNLKHIKSITRYKAILDNEKELEIPKARYKQVKKAFIAYRGEV